MFAIRLLPSKQVGLDEERLGEIVVGDFRESFSCYCDNFSELEAGWREQLNELINGELAVILRYDPRFAWVIYAEGDNCYIQQLLSVDGDFANLLPRLTTTEDGERISEWATSMAEIRQFLGPGSS